MKKKTINMRALQYKAMSKALHKIPIDWSPLFHNSASDQTAKEISKLMPEKVDCIMTIAAMTYGTDTSDK